MGRPGINTRLISIAVTAILALLIAAATPLSPTTPPPLETYKPRDVVKAQYGQGQDEYGFKNWDGECMGAVFFDVDARGTIYIYDGIKGNIKVYRDNGAFSRVIGAVAWQSGSLSLADITLSPAGDVYILCQMPHPRDRFKVFVIAAGTDGVESVPIAYPWSFGTADGGPIYNATGIVSDRSGNVYMVDWQTWRTVRIVYRGKTLPDSVQLASLQEGVPTRAGGLLYYRPRSETYLLNTLRLLDERGRLVRDLSRLGGDPLGTDSLGNIYLENAGIESNTTKIAKYSPEGRLSAVVEIPPSDDLTMTYGKGGRIVVAADGSIYKLIGGQSSVIVRKWERVR